MGFFSWYQVDYGTLLIYRSFKNISVCISKGCLIFTGSDTDAANKKYFIMKYETRWLQLVNGLLQTTCNSSCVCRHGNKGWFCSQCVEGHYKKDSLCVPCPGLRENFPVILILSFLASFVVSISLMICLRRRRKRVVIVLMFAFAVALVALHAKSMIPGWFFMLIFAVWILGLSEAGKNLKSLWSIAVFFFQSLDTMLSDANVWPTKIVLLKYQITNLLNFEFSELACGFSAAKRPEVSFAVILLLPVAEISLIWLVHALGKIFCGRNRNIQTVES